MAAHVIRAWFDTEPLSASAAESAAGRPCIHFHADCDEDHTEAVLGFVDEASRDAALGDPGLVDALIGLCLDHTARCRLGNGVMALALSRDAAAESRREAERTWAAARAGLN